MTLGMTFEMIPGKIPGMPFRMIVQNIFDKESVTIKAQKERYEKAMGGRNGQASAGPQALW
jgi:hypothetical protein